MSQLLSPTNAITSSLLGGELVRFGLHQWPKLRIKKVLYLGQYLELRKISSCINIRDDELYQICSQTSDFAKPQLANNYFGGRLANRSGLFYLLDDREATAEDWHEAR